MWHYKTGCKNSWWDQHINLIDVRKKKKILMHKFRFLVSFSSKLILFLRNIRWLKFSEPQTFYYNCSLNFCLIYNNFEWWDSSIFYSCSSAEIIFEENCKIQMILNSNILSAQLLTKTHCSLHISHTSEWCTGPSHTWRGRFFDFSSTFNTIQPSLLRDKLTGVPQGTEETSP